MLKGDISKFKKTVQLFHIFPIIIFLLISPFNIVSADTQTYETLTANEEYIIVDTTKANAYKRKLIVSTNNVRLVSFKYTLGNQQNYSIWAVSNSAFLYGSGNGNSTPTPSTTINPQNVNGTQYWIINDSGTMTTNNGQFLPNSYIDFNTTVPTKDDAIFYTFGAGAVGPSPSVNYGELKIGFKTDIAYSGGNQDAWRLNKDTIYFDRYDTLGNDLFGNLIELQAVPYSVYDQSKQNLLTKTVNDYVFDTVRVGSLGFWSPGQDYIDFTWEYITNRFSPTWWSTLDDNYSLVGWYFNEKWYRVGWAYRARLVDEDNNELIPWQWIYNGTSIDTEDVVNIIDNNGLTPELVNSINNINNYNNTTNNNTYNNQVVNYYSSDQESDGSWIEALLEMIASTIGNLIDLIKGIFHDLLLGLFNLVQNLGVNLIQFFSDLFDSITDSFGNIDLELPYFDVPAVSENDWFKDLFTQFVNDTVSSGIGFIIFIPLVVILIGVLF